MQAIERHGAGDVDLVVVGTGSDEVRLRCIGDGINARMQRRACVFSGPMADPRPAYAAADIVLGMGGSAARGLALGKPLVVVGEYGWFRAFTPASAAALFRSSFWSEERMSEPVGVLTNEIARLLGEPAERDELGRFGRSFAQSNFGLPAMASRLAYVYDQARSGYGVVDWLYDQRLEAARERAWFGHRWNAIVMQTNVLGVSIQAAR